jgi:SulP family sulfate permease
LFTIALIGFMEAKPISGALAIKSRKKLDPNQKLIGQGLANTAGGFF